MTRLKQECIEPLRKTLDILKKITKPSVYITFWR